jgi:hypothetical protein
VKTQADRVTRELERGYDEISIRQRTCQTCGMLLDDAGEYHPYVFCVLKKAGQDPWGSVRLITAQLQLKPDLPAKPPLVRELHS